MKKFVLLFSICSIILLGCDEEKKDPTCVIGNPCDDNNPITENDVFGADCTCEGTLICTIGDTCDDDNPITENDIYSDNCVCSGSPICTPFSSCDDGDPTTENDQYDNSCNCAGTQCTAGNPCDDGDESTYNDLTDESCGCSGSPYSSSFTDSRDNQVYQTIEINEKLWLAQNINYETDNFYCPDDESGLCNDYGKLYNYAEALTVCPDGWHLPTADEWNDLIGFLGGANVAGGKMKITGTEYWNSPNLASNESGFSARGSGARSPSGNFSTGINAYLWSQTTDQNDENSATGIILLNNEEFLVVTAVVKDLSAGVRCIQD